MVWWVLLGWLSVSLGLAVLVSTAVRLREVRAHRDLPEAVEATEVVPVPTGSRPLPEVAA